jgi:uncharacterized protein involved in exopolysaccharide biosynthesis
VESRQESGAGLQLEELPKFPAEQPTEFRMLEILIVLAKRKRFIFRSLVLGVLIALAVGFLMPKKYEATTRIMPPQQSQSIATAMLTQLGPLAALAGKDVGLHSASDLYIALLKSRTVADDLIKHFSLMQVYGKSTLVDTAKRLEEQTEIKAGKEGVISIGVRDRDPDRAAGLANGYVEELRQLTQTLAVTEAGRRRVFFEHEVQNTSEDLAKAELALKQTQETTGMLQLDSQAKAMIEAYMTLRAQVAAKDAEVEAMRSFATAENPDLVRAQHELAALRSEIGRFERGQGGSSVADVPLAKVPGAGLEYLRRLRELKYREALFELLIKQYEVARIDEAKDAAIIQTVDKAERPEVQMRDWQMRLLIGVVVVVLVLLVAVIAAFVMEAIERAKENSQYAANLQLFRFYWSSGRKTGDVGAGSGDRA